MAGRPSGRNEEACQILLEKLREGQVDLHKNLEHLRPSNENGVKKQSSGLLSMSKERHGRRGADDSLRHLPMRRSRTELLSPSSPTSHSPQRKHRKRLSSTPKLTSSPIPPPIFPRSHLTPHASPLTTTSITTDTSLERALLNHSQTSKKTTVKQQKTRKKMCLAATNKTKSGGNDAAVTKGSSRASERKKEHTKQESSEVSQLLQSSISRVVNESRSIRSRYEPGNKKSRGLTVSFVTDKTAKNISSREKTSYDGVGGGGLSKEWGRERVSVMEEKEKGENLVRSLNSSRFGALEHHRRCGSKFRGSKSKRKAPSSSSQRSWEMERLGYDWIAGMVDAGSLLEGKGEQYYDDMREFRRVNHSECSRPHPLFLPDSESDEESSSLTHPHPSLSTPHTHCTRSYVLNNRLFPIAEREGGDPGEGGKRCPVCEGRREEEAEDTTRSIHYIRVSVPRSSVQAPYQLRPHRRKSFDPSDSMALNKHCLAGWNSTKPPGLPPEPTVDLRSNITPSQLPHSHTSPSTHTTPNKTTPRGSRRASTKSPTTRHLLDTSHRAEYSLRSRGHPN